MRISDSGLGLLKLFEGLELESYQDIAGIWTIGYGHAGTDVKPDMHISEREAEALLRRDLKSREGTVDRLVRVPLNQNEFDALVSLVYNIGSSAFGRSTALRRLNKGDRIGAANAIAWFNKATVGGVLREVLGLSRRRAAEKALFVTPTSPFAVRDSDKLDDNSRITAVEDPPRRNSVAESRTVQGAVIAGGAGAAASSMGRDNAEELDSLESNIEDGTGLTEDASAREGSTPPTNSIRDSQTPDSQTPDTPNSGTDDPVVIDENGNIIGGNEEIQLDGTLANTINRPSKHEIHTVEAQIQFALFILIILAVLFIIFARVDDWRNFRR